MRLLRRDNPLYDGNEYDRMAEEYEEQQVHYKKCTSLAVTSVPFLPPLLLE